MQLCFTRRGCKEDDRRHPGRGWRNRGGPAVLSSPIIDLAIGLTFVFGVTAALASFVTELISRLMGLRAAYLLSGLRELVDGGQEADLGNAVDDYGKMKQIMLYATVPPADVPKEQQPSSITGA